MEFPNNSFIVPIEALAILLLKVKKEVTQKNSFDTVFWENVLPKLNKFYFDNIFPELVYPHILHRESRWNKDLQFPRVTES